MRSFRSLPINVCLIYYCKGVPQAKIDVARREISVKITESCPVHSYEFPARKRALFSEAAV